MLLDTLSRALEKLAEERRRVSAGLLLARLRNRPRASCAPTGEMLEVLLVTFEPDQTQDQSVVEEDVGKWVEYWWELLVHHLPDLPVATGCPEPTLLESSAAAGAEADALCAGVALASQGGSFAEAVPLRMGSPHDAGHALTTCTTSLGATVQRGSGADQVGDRSGVGSPTAAVDVELTIAFSASMATPDVLEPDGAAALPAQPTKGLKYAVRWK